MNNKGMFLIETCIILPVFVLCIYLLVLIYEGWTARIQNRIIARYVSTHHLREKYTPSLDVLKNKFSLHPDHTLSIQGVDSTRISFQDFLINHSFYLWRSHASFF